MSCGDGGDVEALAHRLAAESKAAGGGAGDQRPLIFLDFDRTFCSTKSGADPLVGSHTLDPELLSLACCTVLFQVHVLTRNSHADSIAQMLQTHGVPPEVSVISVPGGSKGEVIRARLEQKLGDSGGGGVVKCIFVDDDLAEHCDPALATGVCAAAVHRVLFTRVM
jgi:hypothetical protein